MLFFKHFKNLFLPANKSFILAENGLLHGLNLDKD